MGIPRDAVPRVTVSVREGKAGGRKVRTERTENATCEGANQTSAKRVESDAVVAKQPFRWPRNTVDIPVLVVTLATWRREKLNVASIPHGTLG